MSISVCIGVYNGAKYIEEQMLSILHQTMQPDQVILCDDGSSDDTAEIVKDFIEKYSLEGKWKLFLNLRNLGYPANFYHAMELAVCDIVFLADQDDIWDEKKLERMTKALEEHLEARAVCCKFGLIDENGKSIRTFMRPARSNGSGTVKSISIEDVFYKCEWPGMVLAYRNDWCRKRIGETRFTIPHDFFVCAAAAEEEGFLQLDQELAWHRRHGSNTGGEEHRLRRLLSKERKLKEIVEYVRILEAFEKEGALETKRGKAALANKLFTMQCRYHALKTGKISEVFKNAKKNRDYIRLETFVCDMLIVKQKPR